MTSSSFVDVHQSGVDEQVPLTRLDNSEPELLAELMEAVHQVASRAAFTLGEEVETFETEFGAFCGVEQAVGVSSGTEALALTLRALRIGPGDEVIVPANSFVATAEAVTLCGATPRFVDVDPKTQLMTAETMKPGLVAAVRAVIPVHLYGRTAELEEISSVARDHDLRVIEDAAQAHGAFYHGRRVGSLADAACFSFYPSKNLGAWGDAGAVTTDDAELADRIGLLRSHGESPRYHHQIAGTTARLDTLQAAVLRIKLRRLDEANQRRRELAKGFDEALREFMQIPAPPDPGCDHVYHQYAVRHEARDELRDHLAARGVASAVHYPVPIHCTGAYAHSNGRCLPNAERLAQTICSLPIYPRMTEREFERVIDACSSFAITTGGLNHG